MAKQKILIVDDDNNIAELISLYLMKECFDTMIVEDGEKALEQFGQFQPNLILLDLMLPGIDGYQVCREIRRTSNVPIIMLSAKGEVFDKVLGLELGADDYIIKPFDSKELVARVKAVLRRTQTQAAYYKNYIDQHIKPRIGDIKLTALTTLQIQKFYNETKAHGRVQRYENMDDLSLSNKTIRGLHTMLRQCLEQAVTERLIPYNPANGCRLPKKEKKKMQIIPPEKIRDYLKAAEEWGVLPMFYLELSTGLRRGELVALLWSDLNLQTKTLTVSKSVSRGKGELVVTEPKTENSVREIYLSDEAIRLLVEDRKNHPFSPYMFPSPKTGGMYGPDCVGRIHKKLLEKAGIEEHVRFHDLRHTFSTLAIQSGIDPKTVAEILGHASAEFSLDVYTHVTAGMKKEAAQKISGFMAGVG